MAAFARGYKRPTPRRELAEDLSGHKGPIGHCAFVRRRRYELAMITSSRLIGKCSRKPHLRSGFRNLRDTVSENMESCYSLRSTPTKRIRCGHTLPETCSRTSSPPPANRVVRRPRGVCRRSPRPCDRARVPRSHVARPRVLAFAGATQRSERRARGAGWEGAELFLPANP